MMREEQAFNDGRVAFREGRASDGGTRRSKDQRAAWRRGYEHEARLDLAAKTTPERLAESRAVVGKLKAWRAENLGGKA